MEETKQANFKQPYDFICPHRNKAYRICISQKCKKSAFMCKSLSCSCQDIHESCYSIKLKPFFSKVQAERATQMPKDIKKLYKQFIATIDLIIEQFSQLRVQCQQEIQFYGMSNESKQFIKLAMKNDNDSINGKLLSYIEKHHNQSPKKKQTQKNGLDLPSIKTILSNRLIQKKQKLINNQLKVLQKQFKKIGQIQPGEDDINLIAKVIKIKKDEKELRHQLTLGDETGNVQGLFFDDQIFENIAQGSQIAIIGGSSNVIEQHIIMQLQDTGDIIKIGNFIQKLSVGYQRMNNKQRSEQNRIINVE